MEKLRIGIVGAGNISEVYMTNLAGIFKRRVTLTAVADSSAQRAETAAARFGIKAHKSADSLIADKDIDIVLNLTPPPAHFEIAMKAVQAGKHVYNEKPLCMTREEAADLLTAAAANDVRAGCSPDTFLGAGLQTCRKLIDDGWIGKPFSATAFMMGHGPESWHPAPEFFYKQGGGPLFDMGPYYITALVHLLGGVKRVCGFTKMGYDKRTITSEPLYGKEIAVDVPTHVAGALDFRNGAVAILSTSFDVWHHNLPPLTIYGSEGTLEAPDPNTFTGSVRLRRHDAPDWSLVPLIAPRGLPNPSSLPPGSEWTAGNWRGLGLVDMAEGIIENRPHRASGELGRHVLDVMHCIYDASANGRAYKVPTSCKQPDIFI